MKATGVAKVLVQIEGFGGPSFLFSQKRAKGTDKHGRLELLGGGMSKEVPLDALIRELKEEEKSGILARAAAGQQPSARIISVEGEQHYIFEMSVTARQYLDLRHDRRESLGFKVVPKSLLDDDEVRSRLTRRTQKILAALRPTW